PPPLLPPPPLSPLFPYTTLFRSLGFIGVGNRGDQVLDAFLAHKDAQVVAVCDIHRPYVDFAARKAGTTPKTYHDYRELLAQKDVDRKSTRLNSSHLVISYAVFCL